MYIITDAGPCILLIKDDESNREVRVQITDDEYIIEGNGHYSRKETIDFFYRISRILRQ